MLPLSEKARMRVVGAVRRKGGLFRLPRIITITLSLLLLLAVPLLGWLRIDLWQGNHLLFGESVTMLSALKGFVVAMAILYGFTFLTNIFVGRFFCGWGCPVGYVSRLGEDVDFEKGLWHKALAHVLGAAFVATFVASIMLWWVDPMVMIDGSLKAKLITGGIFLVLCIGGFMHAFTWRFGFCVHVCPIGMYYRFVTSRAPVGIVLYDEPDPCIECGACVTICPVDIDPKRLGEELPALDEESRKEGITRYGDAECIRCGDCVDACKMVFKVREGEVAPLRFSRVHEEKEPVESK